MGAIYLAVDGGGSKTNAVAFDGEGHVLGFGRGGCANHQVIGLDAAMSAIREAAEAALAGRVAELGCFCLAGADLPPDFAILRPALDALGLCRETVVYNDLLAIFRAGSRRPYGMAVVCGAGLNAGGIGKDGREFRLPALGPLTGDFAGGELLGESAMAAAFRAWDGRGRHTALTEAVLRELGAADMMALAEEIAQGRITREQVLRLAPMVFEVAESGDEVAADIIRSQGREVGVSIVAILRRLDLIDEPCDVVLGGSIFHGKGTLLLDTVAEVVNPVAPKAELLRLDVDPVIGAALLAADFAGLDAGEGFRKRLEKGVGERHLVARDGIGRD